MVERPIKKSELEKRAQTEGPAEDKKHNQKGRKGGRGKGRNNKDREKKKPAVPLALMRGPKPSAKVEEPEPVEETAVEEAVAEGGDAAVETAAGTEAAEATETTDEASDAEANTGEDTSDAEPAPEG